MRIKTKGSELFVLDAADSPDVTAFGCITDISGLGGPAGQIDVSCWRSEEGEYEQGLKTPGQVTVSGIYDSDDEGEEKAKALFDSGEIVGWYIGGSDGTDAPALNTDGSVNPPETRTGIHFQGYVADFSWQLQQNNVWRWQFQIQRSGPWTKTKKTST